MKWEEIPTKIVTLRVKPSGVSRQPLSEQPVFSVAPCATRPGDFEIRLQDSLIVVTPSVDKDAYRLGVELAAGHATLAQFVNPASDGSIELQIAFFSGECLEMDDVEIGVDEYTEQMYSKHFNSKLSGEKLYKTLTDRCCYIHGGQPYFFFFAGPSMDRVLDSEQPEVLQEVSEENEEADKQGISNGQKADTVPEHVMPSPQPTRQNSFCIIGNGIRFVATESQPMDGKSIYIVRRLSKCQPKPDRALRLARGKLTFVDWSRAGQIKTLTKVQMSALMKEAGSYLKKWDDFVEIEGELLLGQARRIGALRYTDMTPNRDGTVTVRIAEASDSALEALEAREIESVELAEELPEYLKNPNLTFEQFVRGIEKEVQNESFFRERRRQKEETKPHFMVTDYDASGRFLTLKTENLPASGTMILSLVGQIAQIKRRMFARKAILEGRAANPQLGLLIEQKGKIAPTRRPSKIRPLSAFVCHKVFGNQPTDRQKEAIEIAINTPDIALIQGPPGTGKTTVIAAIVERLNEIVDKRGGNIKGLVLLTGLQHDAVENVIARIRLNGLPIPKFGKRPDEEEDSFSTFERKLDKWCAELATVLRSKYPQLTQIEQETQIKNLCLQYLHAPTRKLALNLIERILELGVGILGEDCARRAAHLMNKFSTEERLNAVSDPLLEAVRSLRHTPEAFSDDGPERASDLLEELDNLLEEADRELLRKASLWNKEKDIPPFLENIAKLKKKLLCRFTAPPVFRVEKLSDEIVTLVQEVIQKIRDRGFSAKDAESAALGEFLEELENNPYGMKEAVSDYAYAFAATCQQSVNKEMQRQKGIITETPGEEIQKFEYEYVIVDEAARATPPDLLVAMAQGKRIILVGDHRQLPHIIDEAIARQMESEKTGDMESEWLKKSMFEYLFSERLKELEQKDGIRRRVTLDKQYRMHPLLGDFISRNFYERFDPSERFTSGRPASDFAHNLPNTDGKPAVWLEVPVTKGKHRRQATSWIRPVEAIAISHLLKTWMNSEEGKNLSFGIISFYKAQVDLIKQQLGNLSEDEEKLRIGTVDSFQGMEFDVVIVSVVRTMPENWKPRSDEEEIQARGLFGHLCLYNRLNVAMSRQKKLLVVAGDPGLLQTDLAMKYIPALVEFYKLCQKEGKVLACR